MRTTTNVDVERMAAKVHVAWMEEKVRQGFHSPASHFLACSDEKKFTTHCDRCHTDMYPYAELPEHVKDYDRSTVAAVLVGIEEDEEYSFSAEVERLRVQLAGCLVAADGGTDNPAKKGDYGWSLAYQTVLNLRLRYDEMVASAHK